jgi:hypothetical protein
MNGRLRDAFGGGTHGEAVDAAVGRGMADVLTALGNVIDDDAALRHVCGRTAAAPGQVAGTVRARGPAPSRRWLAVGAVAGVAAALTAGAVALATIAVPGARHRDANLTAYVVKRVDSALGAADPGGIAQMTVTFHGPAASGGAGVPATAQEWSYGGRWRAITFTAAGQRLYDEGFSAAAAQTVVSYPARSWARQPGSGPADLAPGLRGCAPLIAAVPLLLQAGLPGGLGTRSPASVATNLRRAISCGTLTEAGRQRLDGIDAIKLTSRPGSLISETVWVSPGTYLPVRLVIRAPGKPASRQTADISWLAPTARNLARLTVPIPAGFRQVPLTQIIKPAMVRIPA